MLKSIIQGYLSSCSTARGIHAQRAPFLMHIGCGQHAHLWSVYTVVGKIGNSNQIKISIYTRK